MKQHEYLLGGPSKIVCGFIYSLFSFGWGGGGICAQVCTTYMYISAFKCLIINIHMHMFIYSCKLLINLGHGYWACTHLSPGCKGDGRPHTGRHKGECLERLLLGLQPRAWYTRAVHELNTTRKNNLRKTTRLTSPSRTAKSITFSRRPTRRFEGMRTYVDHGSGLV